MSEKCFCHLNGFAVKDATARKEMPLIAQAMLEFQNFTYDNLYNKLQTNEELAEGLNKGWFNKPAIAGERFFAVATTSDKITVGFTAEVIRVGSSGTVHFKLIDLVTMYRAPLMILYTLELNKPKETLLAGFKDSAPLATFNRRPLAGEYFYTTLKTPQNDVLTMTARVTGINSAGYAEFESVEVILIHDGSASAGGGGSSKKYRHTFTNLNTGPYVCYGVSTRSTAYTSMDEIVNDFNKGDFEFIVVSGSMYYTKAFLVTIYGGFRILDFAISPVNYISFEFDDYNQIVDSVTEF